MFKLGTIFNEVDCFFVGLFRTVLNVILHPIATIKCPVWITGHNEREVYFNNRKTVLTCQNCGHVRDGYINLN